MEELIEQARSLRDQLQGMKSLNSIVMPVHSLMMDLRSMMKAILKRNAMLHTLLRTSPMKTRSRVVPSPKELPILAKKISNILILVILMIISDKFHINILILVMLMLTFDRFNVHTS